MRQLNRLFNSDPSIPPTKGLLPYLRYAIGEIILIFLGITIAIGFDNWNQNRRQNQVEIETLQEIRQAISLDLNDIAFYYDERQEWLMLSEKDHIVHQKEYLKPLLLTYFSVRTLEPFDYEKLLRDRDFRQALYWAIAEHQQMLKIYDEIQSICKRLIESIDAEVASRK